MAQSEATHTTKVSAAKLLHISRRSVQRYCHLYQRTLLQLPELPAIIDANGKVHLALLCEFIKLRKHHDGRGFPLGKKRLHVQTRFEILQDANGRRYWARFPRRRSKTFGRSFEKRLEFIKAEIDAMTDYQQSALIKKSPEVFLQMFRPEAHRIAENYKKLMARWERGEKPPVTVIPPRPRS
jgi:hypothetical protein